MKKRVFIIHGWGGCPDKGWLLWLNKELSSKGFEVHSLEMPNKEEPKMGEWINFLKLNVKNPDEDTYFVGHSIGCQAIMRYLGTLNSAKIGGVIFVAGWFSLKGLESEEENEIAEPWLKTSINLNNVKKIIKKSVAIFSDNDPYVPIRDSKIFQRELGSKVIFEKKKGHYIENVTKQIPVVLKELLEMMK
ncbi:MAG: alpha/beta hydrolase [Nanoarchaeota archaeon]|nr:alpha/beta hydrolase [Nanoarchaeota archaeon]